MIDKNTSSIVCFKHNRAVHRIWNDVIIMNNDPNFLVCANHKATVYEDDGRYWQPTDPCFYVFLKDKWFNIIVTLKDEGVNYYVNLASPYAIQDNKICYIDYDLDVSLKVGQNLKILDEKEYLHHFKEMGYSLELDYILKKTMYEVIDMIKKRAFPFNDETYYFLNEKYLNMKEEYKDEI